MHTSEELRRQISSTEDLQSVVKTMKALAAVNIRQYEQAARSLQDYFETAELGLRVILESRPELMIEARPAPNGHLGAIVFGSDQGMCGPLNEQIGEYLLDAIRILGVTRPTSTVLAIGERVARFLEAAGWSIQQTFHVPGSLEGIIPLLQTLVTTIESWSRGADITQVYLFYSEPAVGITSQPRSFRLLPIDRTWLQDIRKKAWPTRMIPLYTMEWDVLFSALVREYLFVSLFRSLADSLASENASRLASMQSAERNIEERLAELRFRYHQVRQTNVTEELLDIVAGFEALKEGDDTAATPPSRT